MFLDIDFPTFFDDIESRDNFVGNVTAYFINQGFNKTDSLSILRDNGISISNARFSAIYDDVLGLTQLAERVKYVNKDATPSENILAISPYSIETQYRFLVEFDMLDDNGDYVATRGVWVDTDELTTRSNLEGLAQEILFGSEPYLYENSFNFTLTKGFKSLV